MLNRETSAAEYLKDISLKTNYAEEWRENSQPQTPPHSRNHYQGQRRYENHIELNKLTLKREPSGKYDLKKWQSKQSLIHRMEYPLLSNDPEAEVFLLSKLLLDQKQSDPYSIITIQHQQDGNVNLHSEIIRAKLDILKSRSLEVQTILKKKTQYQPKGKLLPSIPIKRVTNQAINVSPLKNQSIKHSRRFSMPCLQHYGQKKPILL